MNDNKLMKNTRSSLLLQIVTVIYGFILPRLILVYYGSDVNGVLGSITQFLSIISLMELGVGSVVQSSLYKPLADRDIVTINRIITSATRFFRIIAYILVIYILFLIIVYPKIVSANFEYSYVISLIVIISFSTFLQYYFGLVDVLLLESDQRGYVYYRIQIVALILNTVFNYILIINNFSIQFVKLVLIRIYVSKNYYINRKEKYDTEPIKQKWNGLAQHFATIILDNTDIIILTLFSSIAYVSVYNVYNMIVYGIRQLVLASCNGISSYWGNLLARNERRELEESYSWIEWLIHNVVILVFGCTAMLIVPFVLIYTKGVEDVNYSQPIFAVFMVLAQGFRCIRLPYNTMIISGGHYKQTQSNYIIAAILNIVISILMVKHFGIIGVAIGTFVAMLYQNFWMANYNSKHFICWSLNNVIQQYIFDIIEIVVACVLFVVLHKFLVLKPSTFYEWIVLALIILVIWLTSAILINVISNKKRKYLVKIIKIIVRVK